MTQAAGRAQALLCEALLDPSARFQDGQLEAIQALVEESARLLVVQRTGWGKSMVYFIATKMLREAGKGPTLIISPLISLMRNQVAAAERLGLTAATMNCENDDEHANIRARLERDEIDLLLIAPERFANSGFRTEVLASLGQRVGMLVVDEAHCISDWGHDFRPDYRGIARVIQSMPPNLPVLATTATANNRVVEDVLAQVGDHARIIRGTLRRDSLRLQNVPLPHYAARLAWLAEALETFPGSGIIYVLTKRDAGIVADWLRFHGISALPYHGDVEDRTTLEQALIDNQVKALVATTALGMGFDKPDLGFVVHFQRPGSAVHYYQQVGRAGRGIPNAYGILLAGAEDDDIAEYFIGNALPPGDLMTGIVAAIRDAGEEGVSATRLAARFNVRKGKIDQALKLLETDVPSSVTKERSRWFATPVEWSHDAGRAEALAEIRRREQKKMAEYVTTAECLQVFLARELDAHDLDPCGRCATCVGKPFVHQAPDGARVMRALDFLKRLELTIEPRKQWPGDALAEAYGWRGNIPVNRRNEPGRALCRWGDPGWGELARRGKHNGVFHDDLVSASVDLITERWAPDNRPGWITFVPSLRHGILVPDFARRLGVALGLPVVDCVRKTRDTPAQKTMQYSWNQAKNLAGAFQVDGTKVLNEPVLLIDDIVDSKWTLTIIGALLRDAGAEAVHPFAVADTSQGGA